MNFLVIYKIDEILDSIKKIIDVKKVIKGFIIKVRLDKNDVSPIIINCTQITISPSLFIGNNW